MTTQWRKMESWRPEACLTDSRFPLSPGEPPFVVARDGVAIPHDSMDGALKIFRGRAEALRAANAANRRDGLPEVE